MKKTFISVELKYLRIVINPYLFQFNKSIIRIVNLQLHG